MNKKLNKVPSAGTKADSEQKVENMQVGPAIAKPNVVGIPKRIIKFRSWDGVEMAHEFLVAGVNFCNAIGVLYNSDYAKKKYKVKEWSVMQYISRNDINGKEIYEGDIVKWGHVKGGEEDPVRVAVVVLDPDIQFHIVNYKMDFLGQNKIFHYGSFIYTDTENWLEVIGNVFENPELSE